MKIAVINGSPKGKYSVTLQTVLYLQERFGAHRFEILDVGQRIKTLEKDEAVLAESFEKLKSADLILFSYPVYTFLATSQLHRYMELLKAAEVDVAGKFATQITTSKHFFDMTAHRYIEDNCMDLGLKVIKGLSADMDDLLTAEGQRDAEEFFRYVEFCVAEGVCEGEGFCQAAGVGRAAGGKDGRAAGERQAWAGVLWDDEEVSDNVIARDDDFCASNASNNPTPKSPAHDVVIVADLREGDRRLDAMIRSFQSIFPYSTRLVNIAEYPFKGGCLGCFNCAGDGKCIYRDGFDEFLRGNIQKSDAVVYAFTVRDHSMGARFKMYDDRQFCNGHRTVTEGMPFGYIINGNYAEEENLRTVIEGRCEVGHNFLSGVAWSPSTMEAMSKRLAYALNNDYLQPRNFYGVGGMKIFRDLIWLMRGLMKADHEFYKAHGVYDFPHKKRGTMLKMSILGALVRNPKVKAKLGNRMNEGMLAPYRKVLEQAKSEGGEEN